MPNFSYFFFKYIQSDNLSRKKTILGGKLSYSFSSHQNIEKSQKKYCLSVCSGLPPFFARMTLLRDISFFMSSKRMRNDFITYWYIWPNHYLKKTPIFMHLKKILFFLKHVFKNDPKFGLFFFPRFLRYHSEVDTWWRKKVSKGLLVAFWKV